MEGRDAGMKLFGKRKDASVEVVHYAPDVTLTAVDYVIPISLEQRIRRAEARIQNFLNQTAPDSLCETFFDPFAEEEERLIIGQVLEQTPNHMDASRAIAEKHNAELTRLELALAQMEEAIQSYETEIESLQELFDRCNGMEARA